MVVMANALWLASLSRAGSGKENDVDSETTLHLPGDEILVFGIPRGPAVIS